MEEINFITMGDKKYFIFINYSAKLLESIDSNYRYFIYDLGFTKSQREELKSYPNTQVIEWVDLTNFKEEDKFEYICTLKPRCLTDCLKKVNSNKIIYIDGDAFVLAKINEVFNYDFEIGVTIRLDSKYLQAGERIGILLYINAGVIFFNLDLQKMESFLHDWINEINDTSSILREQTALNKLIYNNRFFGYYSKGDINLSNGDHIRIMAFPCSEYNHYEIKLGYNPVENKILHLKGGKFTTTTFSKRKNFTRVKKLSRNVLYRKD